MLRILELDEVFLFVFLFIALGVIACEYQTGRHSVSYASCVQYFFHNISFIRFVICLYSLGTNETNGSSMGQICSYFAFSKCIVIILKLEPNFLAITPVCNKVATLDELAIDIGHFSVANMISPFSAIL